MSTADTPTVSKPTLRGTFMGQRWPSAFPGRIVRFDGSMLPTAIIPMFMPTPEIAFVFLFVNTAGIGIISAMAVTALLAITPAQIRGQIVALYYMAISMGSDRRIQSGQNAVRIRCDQFWIDQQEVADEQGAPISGVEIV